jgi:dTDP-4-dehydrorhamnose 3,5-epimerase-like enzyme
MKSINIYETNPPLQVFSDRRGVIADVFYNRDINHVAMLQSQPGVIRGNHYHKLTTQHILITAGKLEYWYKPLDSDEPASCYVGKAGDLITSEPNEVHAMRMLEYTEFVAFTEGVRGGQDYESDTYRVDNIIAQ